MGFSIMTVFPECPHCGGKKMTFYLVASVPAIDQFCSGRRLTYWICANCGKGVCGEGNFQQIHKGGIDFKKLERIYPEPKPIDAPLHMPENIARSYKTAVKNLRSGDVGDREAACLMARKALELAVNQAGGQGGTLAAKIKDLASRGVIAPALAEWAREIKDIGNEAAHEADTITKEDAEQTVYFAEMLFTYLFTLPGMIAERRK
jgi:HEPN domain-containing protein